MIELDETDKLLLNLIQTDIPLVHRPFERLAAKLGIEETQVLARLGSLKEAGLVRQISAIFDTRALGYQSSLVAMRVPPEIVDEAAEVISSHPGVSHNYRRDHSFNLWFTIALPPGSSLDRTIHKLHEMARAESTRLLPTLRLFKIGVRLDVTGDEDPTATSEFGQRGVGRTRAKDSPLSARQVAALRELQHDIALVPAPFEEMAKRAGISEEALLEEAEGFLEAGRMRRFAAVLHHRKAGFGANGMVVLAAPEQRVEEVGKTIASFNAVSHCYQRPTYPDWPYNLFAMVHARTREACESVADAICEATGISERSILYSTKEYKKVRVTFYTPEFERWEAEHLDRG